MKHASRHIKKRLSNDEGLSLVEVVAAVIIIVIIALSGAGLSINGIQTAAAQERQQVAVTIANGAMETVSGTGVSDLYDGRYSTLVTNAFSANSTQPGVSQTYPQWDTTATASSTPTLPITTGSTSVTTTLGTQNGTNYLTSTLIGVCYQPVGGGNCGKITGQATPPATVPAGYTQLIRIVVLVKWTAGNSCRVNGCYYETSTFADPHTDLEWVTHG